MLYAINATIEHKRGGYKNVAQIPTFYLDSTVQGITDTSHAEFIAKEIINPTRNKNLKVNVTAYLSCT